MKDLLALSLTTLEWRRLDWGPTWRFGHSFVDDPDRGRALLYGGSSARPRRCPRQLPPHLPPDVQPTGAGGVEVFGDLWSFDYASQSWTALHITTDYALMPAAFVTAVVVGLGFVVCLCGGLAVMALRSHERARAAQGGAGAGTGGGTSSRAASEAAIRALPVAHWRDVKHNHLRSPPVAPADGVPISERVAAAGPAAAPSQAEAPAMAAHAAADAPAAAPAAPLPAGAVVEAPAAMAGRAGSPGAVDRPTQLAGAEDEDSSLGPDTACAVCLGEYEDDELVATLPCGHSFHRDCIQRWLRHEGSCPQCRRKIDSAEKPGAPVPAHAAAEVNEPAAQARRSQPADEAETAASSAAGQGAPASDGGQRPPAGDLQPAPAAAPDQAPAPEAGPDGLGSRLETRNSIGRSRSGLGSRAGGAGTSSSASSGGIEVIIIHPHGPSTPHQTPHAARGPRRRDPPTS